MLVHVLVLDSRAVQTPRLGMMLSMVARGDFIGGSFVPVQDDAADGVIRSLSPRDLTDEIGAFPYSRAHVDSAVAQAREQAPHWRRLPMGERCALLWKFRDAVQQRADEIAEAMRLLYRTTHNVAEGAGAAATAALMQERTRQRGERPSHPRIGRPRAAVGDDAVRVGAPRRLDPRQQRGDALAVGAGVPRAQRQQLAPGVSELPLAVQARAEDQPTEGGARVVWRAGEQRAALGDARRIWATTPPAGRRA